MTTEAETFSSIACVGVRCGPRMSDTAATLPRKSSGPMTVSGRRPRTTRPRPCMIACRTLVSAISGTRASPIRNGWRNSGSDPFRAQPRTAAPPASTNDEIRTTSFERRTRPRRRPHWPRATYVATSRMISGVIPRFAGTVRRLAQASATA
jgi:hypothetical protein